MKETIIKKLSLIEKEENIKIIFAVESGSRAWGFESADSDYDVRFIYYRPKDEYLKLEKNKDIVEYPINDLLDINGWDLSKALKLLNASNPSLLEWFQSPIIYKKTDQSDRIKQILNKYYSKTKLLNHHYRIVLDHYDRYIKNKKQVKLKKYFYILRSLSALDYILKEDNVPPIEFDKLRKYGVPEELNPVIDNLLDIKRNNPEMKLIDGNKKLNHYIEKRLIELNGYLKGTKVKNNQNWDELNNLFISIVSEN